MIRSKDALCKHLERGGRIRCEMRHHPEPKTIWTDAETGETVHAGVVKWAMREGKIRGVADGLFDDAPQTFEAAR